MDTEHNTAAESAVATTKKSQTVARKKVSPQQDQFYKAIAMTSAELGAAIKTVTARIVPHVGNALAHDVEAKKERNEAHREFKENIALYYEAKQRLRNPGYRADVDGGKDRTPDENEKNFGAPSWAAFAEKCVAYTLQHADRMLKAFAKVNGLLTDDGENIDDPEAEDDGGAGRPQGRRTPDPAAQKKYEWIATAAMEIANRNPEGKVEKQILAAAEHAPFLLMPVPPDLFSEVLSFITDISCRARDEKVRTEAKQLVNKMRMHQPAAEVAKVPGEMATEEKRKQAKRLARKNGQPLGSAAYNPPTGGTSEHLQRSGPMPPLAGGDRDNGDLPTQDPKTNTQAVLAEPTPGHTAEPPIEEVGGGSEPEADESQVREDDSFSPGDWITLDPACKQLGRFEGQKGLQFLVTRYDKKSNQWRPKATIAKGFHRRLTPEEVRQKFPGAQAAWSVARPQNAMPAPAPCSSSKMVYETLPGGPKVMEVSVPGEPGDSPRLKYFACSGDKSHPYQTLDQAKAECERLAGEPKGPVSPTRGQETLDTKTDRRTNDQGSVARSERSEAKHGAEQGMRGAERITNAQPGRLGAGKSTAAATGPFRVKKRITGDIVDFPVIRDGDNFLEEVFDTESEAKAFCARLNAPPVAGIVPKETNSQSAS